jgi:hypothetical protein
MKKLIFNSIIGPIEYEYQLKITEKRQDSGGFISVNRNKALKENWDLIQRVKRPSNPDPKLQDN